MAAAARAQQPVMPTIGFAGGDSPDQWAVPVARVESDWPIFSGKREIVDK